MLYNLRRTLKLRRFNHEIRDVLNTPPLRVRPTAWTLVSMVANCDVPMYLLGMKSLYTRLGGGRLVAIVHADLPARSRALLERHFPGIEVLVGADLDSGACQRGGTWERLVHILDRSSEQYVLQVDADVLAFGGDLREVLECVQANIAFTLGDGSPLLSMREAAAQAQSTDGDYIGDVAERLFDRYPGCDGLRYVRGSSGFAGFARGGFSRAGIEQFHANMQTLLGSRWRDWGTEQVGSNFAIANSPGGVVLPHPAYASFAPGVAAQDAKLLHFIGTYRFDGGIFAQRGRDVIRQLERAGSGLQFG